MRVLVCDDDADVGDFLCTVFRIDGWDASLVTSGEDCLDAIAECEELPDLLVLDQVMPVLLGTQVAQRLRDTGFVRPIVLCSAHVAPEHRGDVTRLGLITANKINSHALLTVSAAAVTEAAAQRGA